MADQAQEKDVIEAEGVDLAKEDEMLPKGAKPIGQHGTGGEEPDTAGQHGRMAPEVAKALDPERAG